MVVGEGHTQEVLFDPMIHSLSTYVILRNFEGGLKLIYNSSSFCGAGDHGKDGIVQFLEAHKCNIFCEELELHPVTAADLPDTVSDTTAVLENIENNVPEDNVPWRERRAKSPEEFNHEGDEEIGDKEESSIENPQHNTASDSEE